jgi:hypothetical protein
MGGLDVIMISDFYQTPLVQDSWVFKPITNTFNTIALNYWLEYVHCYELEKVMQQDDMNFINILNRFKTSSQTIEDIKCMNNNCLRTPLMDNTLPHLFYTNVKTTNKNLFQKTLNEIFTFLTCDVHTKTYPFRFKLSNLPSQMNGLHYEILVKKKILVELCAGNYET